MAQPVLEPEINDRGLGNGRWMVTIFNNDTNSVDEVVAILIRATGCSRDEAMIETWEAHHYGKAPVHFADREECQRAAAIIESVGVATAVSLEWQD